MLLNKSSLNGLSLQARDGSIGTVKDLLFEDDTWRVRWLIVDTGWLLGRKVLLPVSHIGAVERAGRSIPVDLTRRQVEDSPGLETDLPVSRQLESSLYEHYRWSPYWAVGTAGAPLPPLVGMPRPATMMPASAPDMRQPSGDPHLRSANEVEAYYIEARDGELGHVDDFVVNVEAWNIQYLIVDTNNWWPGKKVLIAPAWVAGVDWAREAVQVARTRSEIKAAPEYDPSRPIDASYESHLRQHYEAAAAGAR